MGVVRTTAFWLDVWLAAVWEQSASCPVFDTMVDWFADTTDPETGGISDRKCAVFVDEGVVVAGVAMVTELAC